eukprot:2835324-Ditylum_brightwellii.AAC.1
MEETENTITELANTSKEIDKAINHLHATYDLYNEKGNCKDKEPAILDKNQCVKATMYKVRHICGGY